MGSLIILGNKLCYGGKASKPIHHFERAAVIWREEMALSGFNCAGSLVLGEEEMCDFAEAAGKAGASALPGKRGF